MASYDNSSSHADHVRSTTAEIKLLTVDRLKKVLRQENLTVSGIKSELQLRLIAHVDRCAESCDYARIERIRTAVRGFQHGTTPGYASSNAYPSPFSNHTPASSLSPQYSSPTPRGPAMPPYAPPMTSYTPTRATFKHSPFYRIIKPLTPVRELKTREQTRDTARLEFKLDVTTIQQLQANSNFRIMVFCSAEHSDLTARSSDPVHISFPQHADLKVNTSDVKHNLKGLKNKPGTTRPADITDLIRKTPTYNQQLELMYALTSRKYFLVINMVQKVPVDTLVAELKTRPTPFLKQSVIAEMQSRASDPDIEATSSVMSLKDPLQMTRIQTPCRATSCRHNACFDAAAFIALQEQAPTWVCPYCNRPATWDTIRFDHYFDEILRNTPRSVDQVTIEPDGRWRQGEPEGDDLSRGSDEDEEARSKIKGEPLEDGNDDNVIEITDAFPSIAPQPPFGTPNAARTPSMTNGIYRSSSITTSSASSSIPPSHTSAKRPHAETIDLTLDSDEDEDDEPLRPRPKRPTLLSNSVSAVAPTSHPVSSYQSPSHGGGYHFQMPPPQRNPFNSPTAMTRPTSTQYPYG